jgi:hypothetical protein
MKRRDDRRAGLELAITLMQGENDWKVIYPFELK